MSDMGIFRHSFLPKHIHSTSRTDACAATDQEPELDRSRWSLGLEVTKMLPIRFSLTVALVSTAFVGFSLLSPFLAQSAHAQSFQTLYTFSGSSDGGQSEAGVL